MAELRTRQPTGATPYPLVLLEGPEQAGKSYQLRKLSASPRVGRTFVFDLGEVPSDEYAPLGRFEIVEHNGTYHDLWEQLQAAMEVPSDPAKPNVIGLDTASALWLLLCEWVNGRARRSDKGRRTLAADPDAEVDTPMNLWNDAKDRWWQTIRALQAWPGIVVLVARAQEVAKVTNGVPVAGQTDYSVQVEKGTPFAVTAQVRMTRTPRAASLVGAKTLHLDLAAGQPIALPMANALEHLIFEVLAAGTDPFAVATVVGEAGLSAAEAKRALLGLALRTEREPQAKELCAKVWAHCGLEGRLDGITGAELEAATDVLRGLLRGEELDLEPPPGPPAGEGAPPRPTDEELAGAEADMDERTRPLRTAPPSSDDTHDGEHADDPPPADPPEVPASARCGGCTYAIGELDSTTETADGTRYHAGCEPF